MDSLDVGGSDRVWVKLDDGAPSHPKIAPLSPEAFQLWIGGLAYCARYLTDGQIPKLLLPVLWPALRDSEKHAPALVAAELWIDRGDHFEVHDYLDYNPSKAAVLAERNRVKAWRESKKATAPKPKSSAKRTRTQRVANDVPSRPVPSNTGETLKGLSPRDGRAEPKTPVQLVWNRYEDAYFAEEGSRPQQQRGYFVRLTALVTNYGPEEVLRRLRIYFKDPPFSLKEGARDIGRFLKSFDMLARPASEADNPVATVQRMRVREERLRGMTQQRLQEGMDPCPP